MIKYSSPKFCLFGIAMVFAILPTHVFGQPPTGGSPQRLTLSRATQMAFEANPIVGAGRFQVVQAEMRRLESKAQLRSPISFSSSLGLSQASIIPSPPESEVFHQIINSISIPLAVGRKPQLNLSQSEAQQEVTKAQFESTKLNIASQVSNAYFDVLRKRALLKVAQETSDSASRQLGEVQKRFKAGDAPELDVLRAQVPLASAKANVEQAENAVVLAEQVFNNLLGQPLENPVTIVDMETTPSDSAVALPAEEIPKRAIQNSPDIRAAKQSLKAAELTLRITKTARDPAYSLQATDTRSNDQTSFSRLDSIMATVTIPLTDGGLARAQTKEAEAAVAQTKEQLKAAEQTVVLMAMTAYRNAKSSLRQMDSAHFTQEIAEISYDKTNRGYQNGLFPFSDVLNAQSALTQARIAYIQAIYDAASATATLNNALGVLPQ